MGKDFILTSVMDQNEDIAVVEPVQLIGLPEELPLIHEELLVLLINFTLFLHVNMIWYTNVLKD